jgi:predicted cupin superfamily sugar epimerase
VTDRDATPRGGEFAAASRPDLAERLDLLAHPEGGWFRETWRSPAVFTPEGYAGTRHAATAIYYLLCPGERSRWHLVRSDELWLWHHGGPLTIRLGGSADAPSDDPDVVTLDGAVTVGTSPQILVPGGVWQSAEPAADLPVLVSCVVAPGFDYADFRFAT